MVSEHKFGGPWTAIKLSVLGNYLKSYSTALKFQKFQLLYIDAFAGSGTYTPTSSTEDGGLTEQRKGSAAIALDLAPAFHKYIFVEKDVGRANALRLKLGEYPSANAEVINSSANEAVPEICRSIIRHNKSRPKHPIRAVLFLDPYGMEVDWGVLEAISATKVIDLWYLFPIGGALRQVPYDSKKMDEHKHAALTRILGTNEWEQLVYKPPPQTDLFGTGPDKERDIDVAKFELYVTQRLEELFPFVLPPIALPPTSLQKFSLFFAISNESTAAKTLAEKIAKAIKESVY